jgi:hypothetical protein
MKKKAKATILDAQSLLAKPAHPNQGRSPRQFADDRLPQGFQTIIDPDKHPPQPWRDLPKPTGKSPFHLSLADVLSPEAIATIENSGSMVFHAVGDTGGVNTPSQIENVTNYMVKDFDNKNQSQNPSFFYHLGDVVYYDGESANYFPEFYEPYSVYPAPIFAIPGNHDGDVNPATGETSLEAFVRNFCAPTPGFSPDGRDASRHTMTQPNVYWTLDTPLATIIGLYSNCPEGGEIRSPQIEWLESELDSAPSDKALILAVHHPLYSAYGPHPGSLAMYKILETACETAQRVPDIVLSGHVHDYQRFTGSLAGKDVPCLIAGSGGYNARLHVLHRAFHNARLPIQISNSGGTLENFCDSLHGYLRLTVTKEDILCEFFAVPNPGSAAKGALKPFDSLTVHLG